MPLFSSTPSKVTHTTQSSQRHIRAPGNRKPNVQHLKVITVNCQSVKKKNLGFLTMMDSVKPHIVLGTESWLKPKIKNSEVFPDGYNVFRNDRKRRTGGGVFVLISKELSSHAPVELKSDSELIWVQIKQKGKKDLYVCSVYRPDKDFKCFDELERTTSLIDKANSTILIGGDLNLGDINWDSNTVNPGATHAEESNKLLDMSESFGLTQFIHEPTRITDTSSNCLDLMFHSNPSLVENIKVIPGFSDHCIPFLDIISSARINMKEKRKILLPFI